MPIDARIPLGVTPLDPNGFTNALAAGMKMRELQNAGERLARKEDLATAQTNALSTYLSNPRTPEADKALAAANPEGFLKAQKALSVSANDAAQARNHQVTFAKANHQMLVDATGAILANPTRENANMIMDGIEAQGGDMSVPRKQLESTKVDAALPGLFKGWVGNAQKVQEMALAEEKANQPKVLDTANGPVVYSPQDLKPGGTLPNAGPTRNEEARARQDREFAHSEKMAADAAERKRAATDYKQSHLTPQAAQKTREKLQTLDVIDAQLGKVEEAFMGPKNPDGTRKPGGIQNSYSAGLGAGYLPTEGGRGFDAAVDALRPFLRQLSRTPGEGAMSDYETRQAEALLPSRNDHESVTKQKIQQLRDIAKQMRSGMAAPAAPPAAPAGRPAPAMVPGADPGVTPEQVEAEMRRRGLLL